MKARSVLLLFPFIMYFAHRTDGCQPTLEATEMQWLEEELADFKLAPHGIQEYTNAIRDNPTFKSLKNEMNTLFETLLKELKKKQIEEKKTMGDVFGEIVALMKASAIAEKKKKEKKALEAKLSSEKKTMGDVFGEIVALLKASAIAEKKKKEKKALEAKLSSVKAQLEELRQNELRRQKEEKEDKSDEALAMLVEQRRFWTLNWAFPDYHDIYNWKEPLERRAFHRDLERVVDSAQQKELLRQLAQLKSIVL